MAHGRTLLLYDQDCGICSFLRAWVHRLDRARRIRSIPIASKEADAFLAGLDGRERFASMHVIGPDGRRETHGMAMLRLVEALPMAGGFARLVASREAGRWASEFAYELLLRLRAALMR